MQLDAIATLLRAFLESNLGVQCLACPMPLSMGYNKDQAVDIVA